MKKKRNFWSESKRFNESETTWQARIERRRFLEEARKGTVGEEQRDGQTFRVLRLPALYDRLEDRP